ncbi:MAG: ribonuclease H-like domain-containing protein [Verrucomicrobia bacterium]|nr:ribonuclease H-like domain-containing protein [Verrucomicrobiota bacterium]MCG2681723.1 ribonuclease H-like domain-containing protein [Kiritimatiellia bacterium]MBU4247184.1 ribonuclease H-like domain-containing protein [Verrucomicrobiota bacterium]MBU4291403.1 ribonuclease H-like domain-containing protein [Verrucomicrobiota bacterium]MBU4428571.1 ribonuclease H-like domain-containing protein [Verrucomicrobiota bacterium]
MLKQSFVHIDGVGETTERRIWKAGIAGWSEFSSGASGAFLGPGVTRKVLAGVEESIRRYAGGHWNYFESRLSARHKWRAYGDLSDRAVCVDIETTGMYEHDAITLIGSFNGTEVRTFILGQNLDDAVDYLNQYPLWITYNGACFDLPFIQRQFPAAARNQIHIDLRYPLKRLGLAGGLKGIENRLGIRRSEETSGLDGWDAVRLWMEYRRGQEDSLRLLTAYNSEDVRNLKPLMDLAYRELSNLCRIIRES